MFKKNIVNNVDKSHRDHIVFLNDLQYEYLKPKKYIVFVLEALIIQY